MICLRKLSIIGLFLLFVGCSDDGAKENNSDTDSGFDSESETIPDSSTDDISFVSRIPDTYQTFCFNASTVIDCSGPGEEWFGQDAQYDGASPSYTDNGDGTVTDNVTSLMWTSGFEKAYALSDALALAATMATGGYDDWRVPTTTELYSLMAFSGNTGSGAQDELTVPADAVPYINTDYFSFEYGQTNRFIDAQYMTQTVYAETVMENQEAFFGVNVADGRIKGYPTSRSTTPYYVRFVRGRTDYGAHQFADNDDDTVSDAATGLMWMKYDQYHYSVGDTSTWGGVDWAAAMAYCEASELAGYSDWRLPNAKELQHLVDYTRSPGTTGSAAIDSIFDATEITNEEGGSDYAFYWTSTTHLEGTARNAAYIAFGRAYGYMNNVFMDVHGAGCQRSDPKEGNPSDYLDSNAPQGDVIRIYNFVRCVREGATFTTETGAATDWEGDTDSATPTSCTSAADCAVQGACNSDYGCTCAATPNGDQCIPACATVADCPAGMNGETLTCTGGVCVPA